MIHRELAQLYYKQGRYNEAINHTSTAIAAFDAEFGDRDGVHKELMTDQQWRDYLALQTQQAMCLARVGKADEALRKITPIIKQYAPDDSTKYEALRKKAKIIMIAGGKGCEAEVLHLYKDYFEWIKDDAIRTLSTMTADEREDYWMRIRPFVADCYQLENADPAFLYDVTLFSKGLLLQINRLSGRGKSSVQALNSLKYEWRQIQTKLPANGCAIEFVQYEKNGKQNMGALVLKKIGNPQWVAMMNPDDFMNYELYGRTNRERLYNTDGTVKNALYNDSTFYSQIWTDELVKLIGKSKKVYFAPDGYLHQVAIEYMIPENLSEADFYRLTRWRN